MNSGGFRASGPTPPIYKIPKAPPGAIDEANKGSAAMAEAFFHSPHFFRFFSAFSVMLGAVYFLGPWMVTTWREILSMNYEYVSPEKAMPYFSSDWWNNQWRLGSHPWRVYEAGKVPQLYEEQIGFLKKVTGRKSIVPALKSGVPTAFVPLCGDSLVVGYLTKWFDRVLALDASVEAITHQKAALAANSYRFNVSRASLVQGDIFAPDVSIPIEKVNFVYDRYGLSAIPPERRGDYAYLIKRSLRPRGNDVMLYVEGIYRPENKKGNQFQGPPFHLDEDDLRAMFTSREGFQVLCDTSSVDVVLRELERRRTAGENCSEYGNEHRMVPLKCAIWR